MRIVPLKELCQIRHGGTPSKANSGFWQGSIPWVSPKDMKLSVLADATDHISEEAVENSATSLVPEGSILVVARSGILVHSIPVAQVKRPLAFNQDIKALIPNTDRIDPDYLFWFVRSQESELLARGVKMGATVHSLQSGAIENLRVPLPHLEQQRRIVDLLSRAEGVVRLRREAQAKAAEIIPAFFLDMFGDPATNPKEWPCSALKTACQVSYGIADKLDTTLTAEQGTRILTISNVRIDGTIDDDIKRYCEATDDQISKATVQRGDLLFNWRNGSETHIGKTAIWESDQDVLHVSFLLRLRPITTRASAAYLWTLLNQLRASGYFVGASRQQVNRKFNASELSELSVPLPPIKMQQEFESKWQAAFSIKRQLDDATIKASMAFDALLGRAFSGNPGLSGASFVEETAAA